MTVSSSARVSSTPTISVVMPSRAMPLQRSKVSFAALADQEHPEPWELLVVDNGSSDSTNRILERWTAQVPQLRVVECKQHGIDRPRNAGVRVARATLIACCDSDDEADRGWLHAIATTLDQFDVVGGPLSVQRLNNDVTRHSRPNPAPSGLPVALEHWRYAVGTNMGFRRTVFDAIGGFDPTFRIGADDIDFCWRAQQAGHSLGFAWTA